MLVLATFVAVGVFFMVFLLRFLYAMHLEAQVERARDVRTSRIVGRIPIAVEVRRPTITVTCNNPGLIHPSASKTRIPGTPMRRALSALASATHEAGGNSRSKRQA